MQSLSQRNHLAALCVVATHASPRRLFEQRDAVPTPDFQVLQQEGHHQGATCFGGRRARGDEGATAAHRRRRSIFIGSCRFRSSAEPLTVVLKLHDLHR